MRIKVLPKAQEIQSVLLATYANGNLGYVPNADNYDRVNNEVDNAHHYFDQPNTLRRSGETIIKRKLKQLHLYGSINERRQISN